MSDDNFSMMTWKSAISRDYLFWLGLLYLSNWGKYLMIEFDFELERIFSLTQMPY